jgi:hypothetical protein
MSVIPKQSRGVAQPHRQQDKILTIPPLCICITRFSLKGPTLSHPFSIFALKFFIYLRVSYNGPTYLPPRPHPPYRRQHTRTIKLHTRQRARHRRRPDLPRLLGDNRSILARHRRCQEEIEPLAFIFSQQKRSRMYGFRRMFEFQRGCILL